tara:strand:- start:344 stop:862 length:519 start_codon:yes stop_codon:yes gene_type:complete
MADAGTISMTATILPDDIQKIITGLSYSYTPATDDSEGWYYKTVDVTTSSGDLIGAETFLQKGTGAAGVDVGASMPAVASSDEVKFLFIKHKSVTDDGSTGNTADSIFICFDGGAAAHNNTDCIEIGPGESWACKLNGCTVANIHAISGAKTATGAGGNKVQAIVAAVIKDA